MSSLAPPAAAGDQWDEWELFSLLQCALAAKSNNGTLDFSAVRDAAAFPDNKSSRAQDFYSNQNCQQQWNRLLRGLGDAGHSPSAIARHLIERRLGGLRNQIAEIDRQLATLIPTTLNTSINIAQSSNASKSPTTQQQTAATRAALSPTTATSANLPSPPGPGNPPQQSLSVMPTSESATAVAPRMSLRSSREPTPSGQATDGGTNELAAEAMDTAMDISADSGTVPNGEVAKKNWKRMAFMILDDIGNHKHGPVFSAPVRNIPNYQQAILMPLDLNLIRQRIREGIVDSTDALHRDILLMFQNAIMWNGEGTRMHQYASEMREFAEMKIREFRQGERFGRRLSLSLQQKQQQQ